jgi:type I restriction enzyme S subunit
VCDVPALRFPEFTGEWERHKLSEVCSFYSGGTPSSSKKEYYNGNIPFIRSGELHKDYTELFITEAGLSNSAAKLVETGDLLLALYGATSGDIAISKIKGAINQAILCIRTKQNKKFIESVWNKHVERLLQTYLQGGQGNLSADIVKNIPFYFANSNEQDKLAKFISLLDERIATQNKIIEKLETLIKGIVETVISSQKPNTLIKNCLECNLSTLQESQVAKTGTFPVYGATGISGYTETADINGESILIIKDGSGVGTVKFVTGKYSYIGTLNSLTVKDGYCLKYIYFALQRLSFEPYKTGMAIPHIYFKDYGKAKIFCPTIKEQFAIAKRISSIEVKVSVEKRILFYYQAQKSYLLSQMLI